MPITPTAHIQLDGVSRSFASRRVLTDISFAVPAGQPTALIGENGTGKSTLLRLVAGLDSPDAGTIHVPGSAQLFHQEPPFPVSFTLREMLDDATRATRAIVDEVTRAGEELASQPDDPAAATRLETALAEAERTDAWQLEHTTQLILEGLTLAHIPDDRIVGELSGGQLARCGLAWTLFRRPDTLLLDEPTNHLDDGAAQTLATMIRRWNGPVLLASHDRAFLDEATTSIVDLDPRPMPYAVARQSADVSDAGTAVGVTRFTGHYSEYVRSRSEERERWQRQYETEQEELKRLRDRVKSDHQVGHVNWTPRSETRMAQKFYSDRNATVVSRRVNDARSSLEQLEAEQIRKPPTELRFRGLSAAAGSKGGSTAAAGTVIRATQLGFAGRLHDVDLTLDAGDRLLLEGPNGSGKSTLLQLLAGRQAPTSGTVHRSPRVRVGLLGQNVAPAADTTESADEAYRRLVGPETAEASPLSAFGLIAGRDLNRPLYELSVGQRRRIELATVLADPPDLLLLDEPTNHFSLLLAEAIEAAVPHYPGTVIVASHDRMLRRRWDTARLSLKPLQPSALND